MSRIFDLFRGLVTAPAVVGLFRGALEAGLLAITVVVIDAVTGGALPDQYAPYVPLIVLGLRTLEGVLDGIDPAKKRA